MSRAHSPQDAGLVLLGVFACGLISLLVGKASLGEVMEVQKQLTAVERERHGYNRSLLQGQPSIWCNKTSYGECICRESKSRICLRKMFA